MNKCNDCKHWGRTERGEYRVCDLAASSDGYPNSELVGDDGRPISDRKALAFALDSSHYGANLITNGDFGCVEWESK